MQSFNNFKTEKVDNVLFAVAIATGEVIKSQQNFPDLFTCLTPGTSNKDTKSAVARYVRSYTTLARSC